MPVAPGTSMVLATCVSAEIDMSFSSDRLKISSFPSLFIGISAGASAVATPPPLLSPSPFVVRFLVAIINSLVRGQNLGARFGVRSQACCHCGFKAAGQRTRFSRIVGKLLRVSPLRTESQLTFSPEVGVHLLKFADLGCRLALFAWSRVRFGSGLRSDERPEFSTLSFRCIDLGFLILNKSWKIARTNHRKTSTRLYCFSDFSIARHNSSCPRFVIAE